MDDEHRPRMLARDCDRYLVMAANARTAERVALIRIDLLQRWRGDPRTRDLAETLDAHQATLPGDGGSIPAAVATSGDDWMSAG